jgi:hypothetical protein
MRWQEIALRLTLSVGLAVAIAYHVAVWLTTPLGFLAIAATAELAVRPYAKNSIDRLLLSCGAVVTALILIGLVLNLTPWGLTSMTWAVAWAILSIGVLGWRRRLGTNIRRPEATLISLSPWFLSASLIFVVAGILALAGVRQWNRQPVLALSLVSTSSNAIIIEIDSTSINKKYRIVATSKVAGARRYSSAPFTVKSTGNGAHILEHVPINVAGAWRVGLEQANSSTTVRLLIVNVSQS